MGWVVGRNGDECNCRSWACSLLCTLPGKRGPFVQYWDSKKMLKMEPDVFKLPGRRLFCLVFVFLASQPIIGMYIEQSIILRARVFDGSGFVALAVDLKLGQ